MEGAHEVGGSYRNDYVLAQSVERAVAAAKGKAMKRLEHKMARFIEGKPFALKVEALGNASARAEACPGGRLRLCSATPRHASGKRLELRRVGLGGATFKVTPSA